MAKVSDLRSGEAVAESGFGVCNVRQRENQIWSEAKCSNDLMTFHEGVNEQKFPGGSGGVSVYPPPRNISSSEKNCSPISGTGGVDCADVFRGGRCSTDVESIFDSIPDEINCRLPVFPEEKGMAGSCGVPCRDDCESGLEKVNHDSVLPAAVRREGSGDCVSEHSARGRADRCRDVVPGCVDRTCDDGSYGNSGRLRCDVKGRAGGWGVVEENGGVSAGRNYRQRFAMCCYVCGRRGHGFRSCFDWLGVKGKRRETPRRNEKSIKRRRMFPRNVKSTPYLPEDRGEIGALESCFEFNQRRNGAQRPIRRFSTRAVWSSRSLGGCDVIRDRQVEKPKAWMRNGVHDEAWGHLLRTVRARKREMLGKHLCYLRNVEGQIAEIIQCVRAVCEQVSHLVHVLSTVPPGSQSGTAVYGDRARRVSESDSEYEDASAETFGDVQCDDRSGRGSDGVPGEREAGMNERDECRLSVGKNECMNEKRILKNECNEPVLMWCDRGVYDGEKCEEKMQENVTEKKGSVTEEGLIGGMFAIKCVGEKSVQVSECGNDSCVQASEKVDKCGVQVCEDVCQLSDRQNACEKMNECMSNEKMGVNERECENVNVSMKSVQNVCGVVPSGISVGSQLPKVTTLGRENPAVCFVENGSAGQVSDSGCGFLKPLKEGWIREVVQHAAGGRINVNYFAPTGKRIRSRQQLRSFLSARGVMHLKEQDFTFDEQLHLPGEKVVVSGNRV